MAAVRISEARKNLPDIANRAALRGERVVIQRRGRDVCAIVPVEDLRLIEELEDKADLQRLRERMREPSESWDKVKADLGL